LPQWLSMEAAVIQCAQGLGIWQWTSNDQDDELEVVIPCCGSAHFIDAHSADMTESIDSVWDRLA